MSNYLSEAVDGDIDGRCMMIIHVSKRGSVGDECVRIGVVTPSIHYCNTLSSGLQRTW